MPDPAGHLLPWALCRPDDVRRYLDREIGAGREGLLVQLINHFSVMVEDFTNRKLAIRQRTEMWNGPRKSVSVSAPPIDRSKALEVKDKGTVLKAGSHYTVDYESGVIRRMDGGEFSEGQDTISVLYTGGIVKENQAGGGDEVPWDLRGAAAMQVAWWFKNRSEMGTSQLSLAGAGTVRIGSASELLPTVRETLLRYKRFVL